MPGFLTSPVALSLTGLTVNTFGAVTCPSDSAGLVGVPSTAVGVMVSVWNNAASAPGVTLRMTGSGDTQTTGNSMSGNSQCMLCTGINGSFQFDCRLTILTGVSIYLVGYFTSAEAVFFSTAQLVTSALTNTNTTFTTTSYAPGATAVFVWCGGVNTGYVRQTGSTDTTAANGFLACPVGVNGSGQFDAKSTGGALYCFGYMTNGIVWNTNMISRTISTTGALTNIPNSSPSPTPVGFVYGPGSSSASTAANYTAGGPGLNTGVYNPNVPSNFNQRIYAGGPTAQINTNTAGVMMEQGYFFVPSAAKPSGMLLGVGS